MNELTRNEPKMVVNQYAARKAVGKVQIVKDGEQIFIEQNRYNFAAELVGVDRWPTSKAHLLEEKLLMQQSVNTIDLDTQRFLANQEEKRKVLEEALAEFDGMIADVEALTQKPEEKTVKG